MSESVEQRTTLHHAIREHDGECPNCGSRGLSVFYESRRVPAHSVLLMRTRREALNYPKGDIELGFCPGCGFISNVCFNPILHEYSARYEETQGFSPTFRAFHKRLARDLVARLDLRDKDILEIGCGKGEFLHLLCEVGGNRGIGIDPAYVDRERPDHSASSSSVTFVPELFTGDYTGPHADLIVCKMTLEHIPDTARFVSTVAEVVENADRTIVFFQIPNVERILQDGAFWDIYYEHCSYFTGDSLATLFRHCGLEVLNLWCDYDDQYLMIEARKSDASTKRTFPLEVGVAQRAEEVDRFVENVTRTISYWQAVLDDAAEKSQRVVIWGGGSKGVTFLNTVDPKRFVEFAVDINPHKAGSYMPGTGQETVAPEFLRTYKPDVVIIMNPVYVDEIRATLQGMGLEPRLLPMGV